MPRAVGSFDVKVVPQASADAAEGISLGRLSIDKQFHGDLEGTSRGEMLSARADDGAAAYVAIERVTGTLAGRRGSFVLMHQGTMTPDAMELVVRVAPGSGNGELAGLTGQLAIIIAGKDHSYDFDYTLPDHRR